MDVRATLGLVVATTFVAGTAGLSAGPPERELRDELAVSVNSAGLSNSLDLTWRWRLYSSVHPLLRDAHITLGLAQSISPRYLRGGASLVVTPLSILQVRLGAEPVAYFGWGDVLLGFPEYGTDYSPEARNARSGEAVSASGVRWFVSPNLRFRVGRLVGLFTVDFERWEVDAPGPYYYEPSRDTLLRTGHDSLLRTTGLLLWELRQEELRTLRLGLQHSLVRVPDAPDNDIQVLGPVLLLDLGPRRFGLREPRVMLGAHWYLDDRWRRHQIGASASLSCVLWR